MALAGFLVGGGFQLLGLAPTNHHVTVLETQPTRNYTNFLDLAFLVLIAVLAWRFATTGGLEMLTHTDQRTGRRWSKTRCAG